MVYEVTLTMPDGFRHVYIEHGKTSQIAVNKSARKLVDKGVLINVGEFSIKKLERKR